MDAQADEQTSGKQSEASRPGQEQAPANGVSTNGHRDLAAWYLEDLRAMRRAQPPGGLRIFNPDETPEEREIRIREALAGLKAMQGLAAEGTEEDGRIWDEVMKSVKSSRSGSSGHDPDAVDS